MITVPEDPHFDLVPFLDAFAIPAVYVAPDGTKKDVRVIYTAAFVPMQYGEGIVVQNESPTAIGAAEDFSDARDAGQPTLMINNTTFNIVSVEGGVAGEVMLILSEYAHGGET